jgi:hypothetical protein
MTALSRCLACAGTDLIDQVEVIDCDGGHGNQVQRSETVNTFFRPKPRRSALRALVCAACGHVHLFASDPAALTAKAKT